MKAVTRKKVIQDGALGIELIWQGCLLLGVIVQNRDKSVRSLTFGIMKPKEEQFKDVSENSMLQRHQEFEAALATACPSVNMPFGTFIIYARSDLIALVNASLQVLGFRLVTACRRFYTLADRAA